MIHGHIVFVLMRLSILKFKIGFYHKVHKVQFAPYICYRTVFT